MKRQRLIVLVAGLAQMLMFGTLAPAMASNTHHAVLLPVREVPICSSGASGVFEATARDDQSAIDFQLTYQNLIGTVSVAHIHFGKPTQAGGIIAFLCGGGGKPDCLPSPAIVTGTITPSDILGPEAQGIAPGEFVEALNALRHGLTYANVHSSICPSGEIRGQITW